MRWFAAELCRRTSASAAAADRHAVLLLGFNTGRAFRLLAARLPSHDTCKLPART